MKSIRAQFQICIKKYGFKYMFLGMMVLVFIRYFLNLYMYYGWDVSSLYHPMKTLTLADNSGILKTYFFQCYPFLVILPAAFSYFSDKKTGEINFLQARLGKRSYYTGKTIAVFLTTFFVFSVPFLIEALLNRLVYPAGAIGDPTNFNMYEVSYLESVSNYFLPELYGFSVGLYAVVFILMFGLFSGILSMFCLAISMLRIKYKILLFIPVFVFLDVLAMFGEHILGDNTSYNYFFFLSLFHGTHKNGWVFIEIMLALTVFSIVTIGVRSREDCI